MLLARSLLLLVELQVLVFSIFPSLPLNTSGSYLPVKLSSHVRYSFSLSTVHKDLSYINTWPPASTDVILSCSSRNYWEQRRAFCLCCFSVSCLAFLYSVTEGCIALMTLCGCLPRLTIKTWKPPGNWTATTDLLPTSTCITSQSSSSRCKYPRNQLILLL